MAVNSGERYSLEALVALYRFEPDLRDVYVEGRTDASLLNWLLDGRHHGGSVFVIDDRVSVPAEAVTALGFEVGAKGRLIALAVALESGLGSVQTSATVIVDADSMHLIGPFPRARSALLVTDGGSMDCYFLQERPLRKFVQLVAPRRGVDAADLLDVLLHLLKDLHAVRVVLHFYAISCVDDPYTITAVSGSARQIDRMEILRRSLGRVGGRRPCELSVLQESASELLAADPSVDVRFARGHDSAPLLVRLLALRSPLNHVSVVEVCMRLSLERGDLTGQPMFLSLMRRLDIPETESSASTT